MSIRFLSFNQQYSLVQNKCSTKPLYFWNEGATYCKVTSSIPVYYSIFETFGQRSQYMSIYLPFRNVLKMLGSATNQYSHDFMVLIVFSKPVKRYIYSRGLHLYSRAYFKLAFTIKWWCSKDIFIYYKSTFTRQF